VAAGIGCAIVALAGSFLIPERYVSKAVLRITPQSASSAPASGAGDEGLYRRMEQIEYSVLGRQALVNLIQEPDIGLYKEDRKHMTIDEVAERMRTRDIHLRLYGASHVGQPGAQAFVLTFDYPDRYKAQQVVRELTARFIDMNFVLAQMAGSEGNPGAGAQLEVLQPADLAEKPIWPTHIPFLVAGLGLGLLLGLLATLILWKPKWTLQTASFAAAGLVAALAIGYIIPSQYVSRAVLRITGTGDSAGLPDHLRNISDRILGHDNLERMVQLPNLDLYKKQRAQQPISEVVEKMRSKDVGIRLYPAQPGVRHSQAFVISFSYPDRFKAQAVAREWTSQFVESNFTQPHEQGQTIEVLETADLPQVPASPNRTTIAIIGACVGLLLGLVTLGWRHSRGPRLTPAPVTA
jgi:hypothetical protein